MNLILLDLQGTLLDHSTPPLLFPDTIHCLQELKERFILALVTEGKKITDINALLSQYSLNHFFRVVLHTRNTALTKIDGSAFLYVLNEVGVTPDETIVIGDVPAVDIRGAKAVGILSVRIRRGKYSVMEATSTTEQADFEVTSLTEFVDLLKKRHNSIQT